MAVTSRSKHSRDPWMQVPREAGIALRAGVPRARRRVIATIRAEVPAYNLPLEGEFGQVVRAGVDGALNRFIDMIERHDADALGSSRSLFYDLGRRAFQEGQRLDALLRAYRVGARVAWREIVTSCEAAGVEPRTIYQLAETVIAYINELSAASTEGYSAESAAAVDVTQAARQALVELLTVSPPPDPVRLSAAVQRARYCLPERIAALACAAGEPADLAARVGPSAIGARIAGLVCVLLPEPQDGDEARIADALQGADTAIGPTVAPNSTAQSWEWARRALQLVHSGAIERRGLVHAEEHLATILLNGDEQLVGALSTRRLAPLMGLSARHGQGLPETLLAWLCHHGDADAAARDLHVHPNTVRYRLEKLRHLYGDALDDPDARFELQLALRASGVRMTLERPARSGLRQPPTAA